MIDQAVSDYHTALVTQFQADYYQWGEVQGWVDGTLDYAASRGLPLWAAQRWSNYTLARDGATIEATAFDPQNRRLTFTLRVPASSEALSVMLPALHGGAAAGQGHRQRRHGRRAVADDQRPGLGVLLGAGYRGRRARRRSPSSPPTVRSVSRHHAPGDWQRRGDAHRADHGHGHLDHQRTGDLARASTGLARRRSATPTNTTLVTSHSVALTGLAPSTQLRLPRRQPGRGHQLRGQRRARTSPPPPPRPRRSR